MKRMIKHLTGFGSIIAISAIMACFLAACEQEPELVIEIPTELQNTVWLHRDGDFLSFDITNAAIKESLGIEKKYMLKETSFVNGGNVNLTILYFNLDNKLIDTITCRNGIVNIVNLGGINKADNWVFYDPHEFVEDETFEE